MQQMIKMWLMNVLQANNIVHFSLQIWNTTYFYKVNQSRNMRFVKLECVNKGLILCCLYFDWKKMAAYSIMITVEFGECSLQWQPCPWLWDKEGGDVGDRVGNDGDTEGQDDSHHQSLHLLKDEID